MPEITSKSESGKHAAFMETHPSATCRPKKREPDETKKNDGQFKGFKNHIASINPGLHHVIREERTFLGAFKALPPEMRNT